MAKTDVSYAQFEETLHFLGFTEKGSADGVIVFRHPETDLLVAAPVGAAEDIVPGMYYEVAQRTIELRGIATRRQFEQALSQAGKPSRRVTKRPRPVLSATP